MIQATNTDSIRNAVQQYGVAPGAQRMLDMELEAAHIALETGRYIVWRVPSLPQDCTRIGPSSRCFCDHSFAEHTVRPRQTPCNACSCKNFAFVPQRPQQVGEWWLPRRKEFDIRSYRVKCRCGHTHIEHDPNQLSCRICKFKCFRFQSAFLCLVCDRHWEEHETIYQTEAQRRSEGRPIREQFIPLSDNRDIQQIVFPPRGKRGTRGRFVKSRK